MKITKKLILLAIAFLFFPANSYALRIAPKPVLPIDHNDVIYSAPHSFLLLGDSNEQNQIGGYILARDKKTKRIKWLVQIYVTEFSKNLEEDVQIVCITEIKMDGELLMIKDEKGRTFSLNINTLEVKQLSPKTNSTK
jgi:hypothetical protein